MKTKELLERLEWLEERVEMLETMATSARIVSIRGKSTVKGMEKCPKCLAHCYDLLVHECPPVIAGLVSKKKVKGWSRG